MNKLYISFLTVFFLCAAELFTAAFGGTEPYNSLNTVCEESDGSFFYPFVQSGGGTRLTLKNDKRVEFVQSASGNNSGLLQMKIEAGSAAVCSGVRGIVMQEDKSMKIRGDVCYENFEQLVKSKCFIDVFLTNLAGLKLYNDPDCTDYFGNAEGGFVRLKTETDIEGKSLYDGKWHTIELTFAPVMLHSTGKYVDMRDATVDMWFRPFAGNAFQATTAFFQQSYLDECTERGITPYVDFLLDNLEGYFCAVNGTPPGDFVPANVEISKKEGLTLGDSVNVTYTLENSPSAHREKAVVLADGQPVMVGYSEGAFGFIVTRAMWGKHLILTLVNAEDAFCGEYIVLADFGFTAGGTFETYAQADQNGTLTYGLHVFGETAQSALIAALYDESRRLIDFRLVPVAAGNGTERIVAEGAISHPRASYAAVYYWNDLEEIKPKNNLKMVYFPKGEARTSFYVDVKNGNDRNDGTEKFPLKTIEAARAMVQPYLAAMQQDIYVYIKGGTYRLQDTVNFSAADSGQNGYNVIYSAWGNETPVISGGREYGDFSLYDEEKNIYRTFVGKGITARQVYVNGIRAIRARNDVVRQNYITADGKDGPGILTNAEVDAEKGIYICDDTEYVSFQNQSDMEAVYYEYWTNPRVKVKNIALNEEGKCVITMNSTSWKMGTSSNNCPTTFPMWFENAYELLNAEGEWYLNKTDGYLYYKPRAGENPKTMIASVPMLERAFTISGDGTETMIRNIQFRGLRFEMFTWLWPSTAQNSYRDSQANHLSGYAGDGRLTGNVEDAAVIVADAENVDFIDCVFTKLGGAGINFRQTFRNCDLIGNHIYDISGTGINLGCASAEADNVEKFRNPTDEIYFRSGNNVTNNLIHDVGIDYRSCVGLGVSWIRDSVISHNEIYNVNYSGMHIGWGWAAYADSGTGMVNVDIRFNYIHDTAKDYLCDSGGIYTLGATGGSADNYNQICYNYFENMRGTPAAIYPDEGSTYWDIANNVVDTRECPAVTNRRYRNGHELEWLVIHAGTIQNNYIHDNFSTTSACRKFNEEVNIFEPAQVFADGNFPDKAKSIIENAGLEPEYVEKFGSTPQRLKLLNNTSQYRLQTGENVTLKATAMGRKLEEFSTANENITFYSTNEAVATVDQFGRVTAVGSGICNIRACYLDGDWYRFVQIDIVCS